MRSLAEDDFRYEDDEDRNAQRRTRNAASGSWLSQADAFADKAASAGFVASMIFLALTASYALSISGGARPFLSKVFEVVDRAAFRAGFRVEDLALSGNRNAPQASLLEALRLPYKGSSLFYDAEEARSRLLHTGWIQSAQVRRILPSRLEVIVSERVPFARWQDDAQKIYVIDREGHLLGPDESGRFSALPLFSGDGAYREAADFEDAVQGDEPLRRRMQQAAFVAERFWAVKLDTGPMIKLPRKVTPLVLERLDSLLASPKVGALALETIDLRLSNRTILQLLEPSLANRDKAIAVLTSAPPQALPPPGRGKAL